MGMGKLYSATIDYLRNPGQADFHLANDHYAWLYQQHSHSFYNYNKIDMLQT